MGQYYPIMPMSRREAIKSVAFVPLAATAWPALSEVEGQPANNPDVLYGQSTIPRGIRSRMVNGVNGIAMHALEAGYETANRPAVLLVHGFPELAYSWRHIMLPIAQAGYHVIAPDQRGYGRSGGTDVKFDDDLTPFSSLNRVRDLMALINALGHRTVACVVGHDFGSPVAGTCALTRPDVFRAVVMSSAPFGGPGLLPFNTANAAPARPDILALPALPASNIDDDLAKLAEPRKHYQAYYTTREANENMWHPKQGLHDFLRAYYYMKSGDYPQNKPFPLTDNSATEYAKLPRYYVMDLNKGMAEQMATELPPPAYSKSCKWLTDEELDVYVSEYGRTGFQGGLQSYRVGRDARLGAEMQLFAGRTIDVPATFISGKSDWGVYQRAGSLETMQKSCTKFQGTELIDGAGHWVQQEKAAQLADRAIAFLKTLPA